MPLDASIPLRVNPVQLPDPVNAMARVLQLRGMQQEQSLNGLKADEYRRGVERSNRMTELLAGGADAKRLREGGFLDESMKLEKHGADVGKTGAETLAKKAEGVGKKVALYREQMANINDPQGAAQLISAMHADPDLQGTPVTAVPLQAQLQGLQAGDFNRWKQEFSLGAGEFIKLNAPQFVTSNTGGQTVTTSIEKLTGKTAPVQTLANTQSPDNKESVGASYANAAATRDAAKSLADATRDAASIKDRRDTEMKLADDYRAQAKNFREVVDASNRVRAALPSATKSAASTLTAATSFMKMLDPGSVVRESELGMALAATGAIDRLSNYHNRLLHGQVLTASQVKDFTEITDKVLQAAKQGQQAVDSNYRGKAQRYQLRPDMIIQDLGQGQAGTSPDVDALVWKYGGR